MQPRSRVEAVLYSLVVLFLVVLSRVRGRVAVALAAVGRWRGPVTLGLSSLLAACASLPGLGERSAEDAAQAAAQAEQLAAVAAACEQTGARADAGTRGVRQQLAQQAVALQAVQGMLHGLSTQVASLSPQPAASPLVDCAPAPAPTDAKLVVGRREQVWVEELQLALPARIDTGAETASLDARNIAPFERDGRDWVRFDIVHPESGETMTLEHEVTRVVRVLQSTSDEGERRPVIELGILIGDIRQRAEFTLSDRSHLDYQMLIGRNVLLDLMVVDVSKVNVAPFQLPVPRGSEGAAAPAPAVPRP